MCVVVKDWKTPFKLFQATLVGRDEEKCRTIKIEHSKPFQLEKIGKNVEQPNMGILELKDLQFKECKDQNWAF